MIGSLLFFVGSRKDLNHFLLTCQFASSVWDFLFQTFGVSGARFKECCLILEETFGDVQFLRFAVLGGCGMRETIEFSEGLERSWGKGWALVWFHISLWALVFKDFCNYPLGLILLD